MTNKTNQSLLHTFQSEFSIFERYANKICYQSEIAEDILQQVALKLLSDEITVEVKNNKSYLMGAIRFASWTRFHIDKKYVSMDNSGFISETEQIADNIVEAASPCTFQEDMIDSIALKKIRKASNVLPPAQKQAIQASLNGDLIGEELGIEHASLNSRYESLKTNRRLAIQKLRDKLA